MMNALFAFDEPDLARAAADRLQAAGLPRASLRLHLADDTPTGETVAAADEQITGGLVTNLLKLFQGVFDWGGSPHDASAFENVVRTGGGVLEVSANDAAERDSTERALAGAGFARRTDWREVVTR